MPRPSSQHPTFVPGSRLSRLPAQASQSLENFYRDLFANTGPENDRERLLQLLDQDVENGIAAQGRTNAQDHLDRAFRRIDAWTHQGDYLPQADRTELKRRVAHNLLAALPGLDLAAKNATTSPDHALLRQVQAEHAAARQKAPAPEAKSYEESTGAGEGVFFPPIDVLQNVLDTGENAPGPIDETLEGEFDLKGAKTYWTVQPNPGACEKCQALAGKVFTEKPGRPHPNCKCLIQEHKVQGRMRWISGSISGFEDIAMFKLSGGKQVIITVRNMGPALSGISIETNYGYQGSHIAPPLPGTSINKMTFYFNANNNLPVTWNIRLQSRGADNTIMTYIIVYMEMHE